MHQIPAPQEDTEPVQPQESTVVEPEAAGLVPAEEMAPWEPETEEPEVTAAEQEAVEPEETVEEPHQPEPEPEPEPESAPDPESEPAIALPSFMHKPAEEAPPPMAKSPHIVDAPDGPPENQIEVPAGMLARISTLDRIPASQIDEMRAVQAQLEALHERLSGTGKE